MTEEFNPQTILEIVSQLKKSSGNLYEALGPKTTDSEIKNLWGYLKQDSELHSKVLKEMCDKPESYVVYELAAGEYNLYLKEVIPSLRYAKEVVVKKTKELFDSDLAAVEFAIYLTIELMLAYSTLKDYILPQKLDLFNKIAGDEKKHLTKLNLAKRKLME